MKWLLALLLAVSVFCPHLVATGSWSQTMPDSLLRDSGLPTQDGLSPYLVKTRPLSHGTSNGLWWGFVLGTGMAASVVATPLREQLQESERVPIGLGLWAVSTLCGAILGRRADPIVTQALPQPSLRVRLSLPDADHDGSLTDGKDCSLLVSLCNLGSGQARNTRLEISAPGSGEQVLISYQGKTGIGTILGNESKDFRIAVKPRCRFKKTDLTLRFTCSYQTEWGARRETAEEIRLTVSPDQARRVR